MKYFIYFTVLIINSFQAYAQSRADSLIFAKTHWKIEEIANGVIWNSYHFQDTNLFNANLNINFIEFNPSQSIYKLQVVTSDSLQPTSELANKNHAIAAINGSFFRTKADDKKNPEMVGLNRSSVYMRINGLKITDNTSKNNQRKLFQQGSLIIDNDSILILKAVDSLIKWEESLQGNDLLTSGPMLLMNGAYQTVSDTPFNKNRHPRTAIGKKANGAIILFVVDGRSRYSYGLTIPELQQCLKWIGCVDTLNMDGGGSTTMVLANKEDAGVVNCPSDNKVFDHKGERAVSNAIIIVKKE